MEIVSAIHCEKDWHTKALASWNSIKRIKANLNKPESELRSEKINSSDDRLNEIWMIKFRIIDRGIRPTNQIVDEFDSKEYWQEHNVMIPKSNQGINL